MKILSYLFWLCVVPVALADVTISNVKVEPVMPWGKACITYDVGGTLPEWANDAELIVTLSNRVSHAVTRARAISGEKEMKLGTHHLLWDFVKDNVDCSGLFADFTVVYESHSLYQVIDLSEGASASSYPVTSVACAPTDGWSEEYKTTKLVLRRIDAGSFIMGASKSFSDESHRVILTKTFYVGVFEVTQRQWELVMGTRPSYFTKDYALKPVDSVSYDMIRGSNAKSGLPEVDANSFLGILRTKTGLDFDLPTEAQWEYACRAGSTLKFSYGENEDGAYMWYRPNSDLETHTVGTKLPNAWGLYDMHGNVGEWCMDFRGDLSYGEDPVSLVGDCPVDRGGGWFYYYYDCTANNRGGGWGRSSCLERNGFRLCRTLLK